MTPSLVRLASSADADQIGSVHARAWREAYRDLLPVAVLERTDATARASQWLANIQAGAREVFVALSDDVVVGFCSLAPSRDAHAGLSCGEITALYVDPTAWRCGHGRALVSAARRRASARWWKELTLWVLNTNQAARAFYLSQGFLPDGAEKSEGDPPLPEIRYRSRVEAV